jgi:hypothetical protein
VGEQLRESQVIRALASALAATGIEIRNVTCRVGEAAPASPCGYEIAIAPWHAVTGAEIAALASVLDQELGAVCPSYGEARRDGRLAPARVRATAPDAFFREWEREVASGVRPPQVKDRIFQRDASAWARIIGAGAA